MKSEQKKVLSNVIEETHLLKIVLVEAKLRICPLTIPIPRSSLAFSSSTIELNNLAG